MISLIAAMDEKRGIGKNNKLLWHIPADFARFKKLTTVHPIIMGRKTFESIGRLLPNRTNIIVTRDSSFTVEGAIVAHSFEEAITFANDVIANEVKRSQPEKIAAVAGRSLAMTKKEVFVIGGGQIYAQALPLADKLYLTIVEGEYDADTFFPEYELLGFKVVREEKGEENGYTFRFADLER